MVILSISFVALLIFGLYKSKDWFLHQHRQYEERMALLRHEAQLAEVERTARNVRFQVFEMQERERARQEEENSEELLYPPDDIRIHAARASAERRQEIASAAASALNNSRDRAASTLSEQRTRFVNAVRDLRDLPRPSLSGLRNAGSNALARLRRD